MYGLNSDFQKRDVAIYARVSTEHEAQLSALGNQLDWYKPILAARPDWTLTAQYIDEGITGTSAEKRPQFMKMVEDARQKKFNMIITREVSRFARNTVDTLQYTRLLKEYGVEVFFLNDNIKTFDGDGELRLTIMATLAQANVLGSDLDQLVVGDVLQRQVVRGHGGLADETFDESKDMIIFDPIETWKKTSFPQSCRF